MKKKFDPADCTRLLVEKQEKLRASGESRLPKRSDFEEAEVVAIKAFLGPWPRALEAAGLKEARSGDRIEKNREKRARAARARRLAEKNKKGNDLS